MRHSISLLVASAVGAMAATGKAQYLMATDVSADRIMLFNRSDGSVANAYFINDDPTALNYDFRLPWDAIQVGGEVWVSDNTSDQLIRFDVQGNWIATIATGLDNPRGMAFANGAIYVCNLGLQNGAPGPAVIAYSPNGVKLFHFTVNAAADVMDHNGELLISNYSNDDLQRYSYSGTFLGTFHASNGSTGINDPAQLTVNAAGRVLAAGYLQPLMGIFEYDSTGVQTNYWAAGSQPQGVAELDNGKLLYSDSTGVRTYDIATGISTDVLVGLGAKHINRLSPPTPPTAFCTAGTTTHGCVPQISGLGNPSASAGSGFTISVALTEGQKQGLIFYGVSGQFIQPWATGSNSFLCVKLPLQRTWVSNSGGTLNNCNGTLSVDWNAFIAANPTALGIPFAAGAVVDAQGWFRDPTAPKTTNLSNGLEFSVQP